MTKDNTLAKVFVHLSTPGGCLLAPKLRFCPNVIRLSFFQLQRVFLLKSGISTTKFDRYTWTDQYFVQNYFRTGLYFLLLSMISNIIFLNILPLFPISTIINRSSKFVFPMSECLGPGGDVYDHPKNVTQKSHYINQNIVP